MKRLLIAGFGDIARRAMPQLERGFEVLRLARRYGFDLDRPETLRLEAASALLHCAPPRTEGDSDTRTANLLAALEKARILPARVVYVSTSGVYGDCRGARSTIPRPPASTTSPTIAKSRWGTGWIWSPTATACRVRRACRARR